MMSDPFRVFECWLGWLDSPEGMLWRLSNRNKGDCLCTIPTPPGSVIFTVGDLRALVAAGREWREAKKSE